MFPGFSPLPARVRRLVAALGAAVVAVAALASVALAAKAQPAPSPGQPPSGQPVFSETVEVRVVNVEVVVTDRDGNRVPGLTAADFELLVDRAPVTIDYFTEVRGGRSVAASAGATAEVPSLEREAPVPTSYLVFIDDFFALPVDRNRVLERLAGQLNYLMPEDRMAVVAYDGRDLELLSTWSQSTRELDAALRQARDRPARGLHRRSELRQALLAQPPTLPGDRRTLDDRLGLEERYLVERLTEQLDRMITAAAATMRGFASPQGRKVFLLLAGGWPWDPVEYLVNDVNRPFVEPHMKRGDEIFEPLIDTANLLSYTLYPVDVAGLEPGEFGSAEQAFPGERTGDDSFLRESGVQQTLLVLADRTGGEAMLNARRDQAFERAAGDTRSFYWLGFVPRWQGNDQQHEIEVKVRRPGLRVRSRSGFVDSSRQREVTLVVESALLFGSPPTAAPLLAQVGKPTAQGRKMQVPISIAIPVDAITVLPQASGYGARFELRVAVRDESGRTADIPVIPLEVKIKEKPKPGGYLRYDTSLLMRRRPHDLVLALYDLSSGAILSTALEVKPEKPSS